MSNDITRGQRGQSPNSSQNRNQNDQNSGDEIPGDMDAPDIVGRTGEEMPEGAHDNGAGEYPDDAVGAAPEGEVRRKSDNPG